MEAYLFRNATLHDAPFLADVIIAAEKGMSDKLSYCTLFEITEEEARQYIITMLEEEIDGCELSISSFIVAEYEGVAVAALGAWIEEYYEGMSSQMLKSNLISYTLGRTCIEKLQTKTHFLKEFQMQRTPHTMQFEYLYVKPEHIGKKLEVELVRRLEEKSLAQFPELKTGEAQLFKNSVWSIKLLMKFGYRITQTIQSSFGDVKQYLPHHEKVLMQKDF